MTDCLVIGLDIGGSKTLAVAVDGHGEVAGIGHGPGIAAAEATAGAEDALGEAIGQLPVDPRRVDAVWATLGGLNTAEVDDALRQLTGAAKIHVSRETSGETIAGCAAYWNFAVAVMAGTGSLAVATHGDARVTVGGWGPVIDDRGSCYAIGQEALRLTAQHMDGRRADASELYAVLLDSPLFRHLPPRPDLSELERWQQVLPRLTRRNVADLARLVDSVAAAGDPLAQAILGKAGRDLATLATAAARALHLDAPRVVGMGGAFRLGDALWRAFRDALTEALPGAAAHGTDFDLAVGSALMALQLAGVPLEPRLIDQLDRSYNACRTFTKTIGG